MMMKTTLFNNRIRELVKFFRGESMPEIEKQAKSASGVFSFFTFDQLANPRLVFLKICYPLTSAYSSAVEGLVRYVSEHVPLLAKNDQVSEDQAVENIATFMDSAADFAFFAILNGQAQKGFYRHYVIKSIEELEQKGLVHIDLFARVEKVTKDPNAVEATYKELFQLIFPRTIPDPTLT
jgi:hypothetical protein